jgi:protocatechuate 3,4-dioxygenase beta subunit
MPRSFRTIMAIAVGVLWTWPSAVSAQVQPAIHGRVLDTSGRPVEGVEILLNGVSRTVTTGSTGRFVFDGLSARVYALTARRPGFRPTRSSITVGAAAVTEVVIRIEQYVQVLDSVVVSENRRGLYGVVGDSARRPIVGARVEVFVGQKSEPTDSAGRFAYPDIKSGDYVVLVSFPGLAPRNIHVTVPRNGATEVSLILLPPSGQADPPGIRWVFHDLGMRLAFHPRASRLGRAELARFAGRQLCDIPMIRGTVSDLPLTEVDGIRSRSLLPLCTFSADELTMVELTCSGPTALPRLSSRRKSGCIRVWTR